MAFDSDESYFWHVYPKLAAGIQRLRGARLAHEREPEGALVWFDDSDPEDDPPDEQERSRSYHLFFVCPEGKAFTYETEIESLAEAGLEAVAGTGTTGWSVAVSLLAPFAVIALSELETFEDGSVSEPAIESMGFTEAGRRIDPEAEFRKFEGQRAFEVLLKLRGKIDVLPEEDWRKPVPWLRADEGILAGSMGEPGSRAGCAFFRRVVKPVRNYMTKTKNSTGKKKAALLYEIQPDEAVLVLRQLLTGHPDLVSEAEEILRSLLRGASCESIASEVENAIRQLDFDDLNGRAGRHSWGYTEPAEAAGNAVDEWIGAGKQGASGSQLWANRRRLLREFADKHLPEWPWISQQVAAEEDGK